MKRVESTSDLSSRKSTSAFGESHMVMTESHEQKGEHILNDIINQRGNHNTLQHILEGNLTGAQIHALADFVEHHSDSQTHSFMVGRANFRSLAHLGQSLFSLQEGETIDLQQWKQDLENTNLADFQLQIIEQSIPPQHSQKPQICSVITNIQTHGIVH